MKKIICFNLVLFLLFINVIPVFASDGGWGTIWTPVTDDDNNGIDDSLEDQETLGELSSALISKHIIEVTCGLTKGGVAGVASSSVVGLTVVVKMDYDDYVNAGGSKSLSDWLKDDYGKTYHAGNAAELKALIESEKTRYGFTDENIEALDNGTYTAGSSAVVDFDNYFPPIVNYDNPDWEYINDSLLLYSKDINTPDSYVYYSDYLEHYPDFYGPLLEEQLKFVGDNIDFKVAVKRSSSYNMSYYGLTFYVGDKEFTLTGDYFIFPKTNNIEVGFYAPVRCEIMFGSELKYGLYVPIKAVDTVTGTIRTELMTIERLGGYNLYYDTGSGMRTQVSSYNYFYNSKPCFLYDMCFGGVNDSEFFNIADEMQKNSDGTYTNVTQNITYNPALDYSQIYDAVKNGMEDAQINYPRDEELNNTLKQCLENWIIQGKSIEELPEGVTKKDIQKMLDEYIDQIEIDVPPTEEQEAKDYTGLFGSVIDWLRRIRDSIVSTKNYVVDIFHRIVNIDDNIEKIANDDIDIDDMNLPITLKDKFPFCIPWDFYHGFTLMSAPAVEPVFEIPFNIPMFEFEHTIHIDLRTVSVGENTFDMTKYIKLFRYFVYLDFVICLVVGTKSLITH